MSTIDPQVLLDRAERHAGEAERSLEGRWLSSWVKAQAHATLAVYYLARAERS